MIAILVYNLNEMLRLMYIKTNTESFIKKK